MKSVQVLELYNRLLRGERLSKDEMSNLFGGKSLRTVQRYISDINTYLSSTDSGHLVQYDNNKNQFYLAIDNDKHFSAKQILLLTKILLSTRSLSKEETTSIINNLMSMLTSEEKEIIHKSIDSESFHYSSELDEQRLLDVIWDINYLILQNKVIEIEYSNAFNKVNTHIIKPLYITFSEFYYYLVGIKDNEDVLIFRVDRIQNYKVRRLKFKVEVPPYKNEGELKKRIYFMYGGDLKRVQFEFSGGVIESVVDRFPTAELLKKDYQNTTFLVEIEVIGDGIIMWLLSQGARVKVLSPQSIVDKYDKEVLKMYKNIKGD